LRRYQKKNTARLVTEQLKFNNKHKMKTYGNRKFNSARQHKSLKYFDAL
jgi:hypothetical protein